MKKILTIICALIFVSSNLFAQSSINGNVYYHGDTSEPLELVNVKLIDTTGIAIDSCVTDINGLYQFNNVQDGTYTIESSTEIDPGGIDLADAHQIRWYLLGFITLTPIQQMAADVDGDSTVTWNDYITIVVYYFAQGNPFPAGDWSFETITYVLGNKQKEDPPPIGSSSNGDVDGSFEPGNKPNSDLFLDYIGEITVNPNEEFEIPVNIDTQIPINSMGLVFNYPQNLYSVIDVTSDQGNINFQAADGKLKISCIFEINKVFNYLVNPEIRIKLRAKDNFENSYNMNFSLNEETHIIDAKGNRIINKALIIPNINILDKKAELGTNYPNPFNNNTSIDYKIPVSTHVTIKLYNLMGQEVATLVDKFREEGQYKVNINSDYYMLKPGKYIYKMNLYNNNEFSRSKIMVVL